MTETAIVGKQERTFVSDEVFVTAVMTSETYREISEKTGQKLSTTMARYKRVKKVLEANGVTLPQLKRATPVRSSDNVAEMIALAKRLSGENA